MKKSGVIIVVCISIIILSLSFVSANAFADFWDKFFKGTTGDETGELATQTGESQTLIAHYSFENNADDETGNHDGTPVNNPTYTAGVSGQAMQFDGIDDYIHVADTPSIKYTGEDITLSAWIYVRNTEVQGDIISKPWNSGGKYNYRMLYKSNEQIEFIVQGSNPISGYPITTPIGSLTKEKWHYITATVDSAKNMKIYIDGELKASGTHAITAWDVPDQNIPLAIGTLFPYGDPLKVKSSQAFDGLIDEVKIYNYALTDAEILEEYESNIECTDSDNGKDYRTKGTITFGNVESTDTCKDDKILEEYYCFNRVESEDYECFNNCESGACINEPIEILSEYTYVYPSLTEEGQDITFYHEIKINPENKDLVPESYLINIEKENGEIQSMKVFKGGGHCESSHGKMDYCYVEYSNTFSDLSTGDYEIMGADYYGKFKILKKGWFDENLILDEKYGESIYQGFYDPYKDFLSVMVFYDLEERPDDTLSKIAGLMISDSSEDINNEFDDILEELIEEEGVPIQLINLNGNNIYLVKLMESDEFGFVIALWKGENYMVYVGGVFENKEKREIDLTEEEFMRALMGRGHSYKREEVSINDFGELGKELVEKYLEKWESTLTNEPIACFSQWECNLNPLICPEYGRQTETCWDTNNCTESKSKTMTCQPGLCSGCLHDGKCIPYGSRFQSEDVITSLSTNAPNDVNLVIIESDESVAKPIPAVSSGGGGGGVAKTITIEEPKPQKTNYYCDIDGRIKEQKTPDAQGNWANCQNNYECESNVCSSGECIEVTQMIQTAKKFKVVLFKLLCKIAHPISDEKYNQCIIDTIGEEYVEEPDEPVELITPLSDCGILNKKNGVYELQKDITTSDTCFTIKADNVTLDLNGHSIVDSIMGDGEGHGVSILDYNGAIIKNGNIYNFYSGVYLENNFNTQILNINFPSVVEAGIVVLGSENVLIKNNTIFNSTGGTVGIACNDYSKNVTIENNEVYNTTYGIMVSFNAINNTIQNNGIHDNENGILIEEGANGNLIQNNIVSFNSIRGLEVDSSNNNIIINNTISNNNKGIRPVYSNNNIISNNDISNNRDGIDISYSNNNIILNNNIDSNEDRGIGLLNDVTNNTIINNNILNNHIGIYHNGIYNSSNNHHIYHNNFINNDNQVGVHSSGKSLWDNGILKRGNYWSDYDEEREGCYDTDSDGICNSPYVIDTDNQDNYPFKEINGWIESVPASGGGGGGSGGGGSLILKIS